MLGPDLGVVIRGAGEKESHAATVGLRYSEIVKVNTDGTLPWCVGYRNIFIKNSLIVLLQPLLVSFRTEVVLHNVLEII